MKIECNEGSSGAWTWRVRGNNNQVIAHGDKTYETAAGVQKGAEVFAGYLGTNVQAITFDYLDGKQEVIELNK